MTELRVGLINQETRKSGCDTSGNIEKIVNSGKEHGLDLLVAPEWFFHKGEPYTKREKKAIVKEIISNAGQDSLIIPGTFIWRIRGNMYNSAPIITNGKSYRDYHKHTDGWTQKIATEHGYSVLRGFSKGKTFSGWRKIKVGIEICSDHLKGCLKTRKKNDLDMQIVLACGCKLKKNNFTVREGGYFLYCDGYKSASNSINPRTLVLQRINSFDYGDVPCEMADGLAIYTLSLDNIRE